MSLATLAARASSTPDAGARVDYVPGVCNIGPQEIARRRWAGHLAAAFTIGLLVVLIAIDVPAVFRFVVALPAAGAAAGYLQAWLRFCAAFGSAGEFNFGPLGRRRQVTDATARSRDRHRAAQIALASGAIGAAVGIVAVLLP